MGSKRRESDGEEGDSKRGAAFAAATRRPAQMSGSWAALSVSMGIRGRSG